MRGKTVTGRALMLVNGHKDTLEHSATLTSKKTTSQNMMMELSSQSVYQSLAPCQIVEGQEEDCLKIEIVCHEVDSDNVDLMTHSSISTKHYTESPSINHSTTNLVQDLKKWSLKHNIQLAAFRDLLEILSTYYPEHDLKKEFEDFDLLNNAISVDGKNKQNSSKTESSSVCVSSVSVTESVCPPIEEDGSDQQAQASKPSKRRRKSGSKTEDFSRFKDDFLQMCRSELRQVCQEEMSKWSSERQEHTKTLKDVAADLKLVKDELKSIKSMMSLPSKSSKW